MSLKGLCENEYRVFGVPGSGKTTYLTKKVQGAVEKGYKGDLLVASFTRAAAAELAGRDMNLGNHQIGTLHAHCYGALGQPTIAETKVTEFNEEHPDFAMSKKTDSNVDEQDSNLSGETRIDELFAEYNLNRNRKVPREVWKPSIKALAEKWEDFKAQTGYFDFTDLIEHGLSDMIYPPNRARVGIFDEVQDFTPLQMDLIRHWAKSMKYLMIAGDDDQAIMTFMGATPDTFLDPQIPDERITTLGASYRCPSEIQAFAQRFLTNIKKRQEKPQQPRKEGGEVNTIRVSYKMPRPLIKMIEQDIKEENDLGNPRTIMVLTSCSYMLYPIRRELRERGIPFHNPYRRSAGAWNPLSRSPTATPSRILAYLNPRGPYMGQYQLWTAHQLQLWFELIKSNGLLQKGAKKKLNEFIEQRTDYDPDALLDLYMELFHSEGLEQAVQLDPGWLRQHTTADKYKRMDFPMRILHAQGKESLERVPQVIIGTIHSTKGGQCDTVYLAPDLSMRSAQDYAKGYGTEGYEAIMRQFYVGATRARERLNLLIPANTIQSVKEVFK